MTYTGSIRKFAITTVALIVTTLGVAATENGRIAFTSDRDGNPEIYIMNADGSNQTQLTNNPTGYGDVEPALSPDGMKIAFTSHRHGDNNTEIYVMRADGSGQNRLTDNTVEDSLPAWSPDGTMIVYVSEGTKINVINAAGGPSTTIFETSGFFYVASVDWSATGNSIAFELGSQFSNDIFTMNPDGTNLNQITSAGFFEGYFAPARSPDGSRFAFGYYRFDIFIGNEITTLDVMNANGSDRYILLTGRWTNPDWAPDGAKIAVDNSIFFTSATDIYVINQDGSAAVNLTNSPANDYDPSWGPANVPASSVSVGGRVITPGGSGLRNAVVSLTDPQGVRRTVLTSAFGFYKFENVAPGIQYLVSVTSKRFRFDQQSLLISENITGLDFQGSE